MKKQTIFFGAIILGILLILSACSDKGTGRDRTEGDYQDESYLNAQNLVVGFTDSLLVEMNRAFAYMFMDGFGPGALAVDSVSNTYDPETCWWEFYIDANPGDTSFTYIDSLKFIDDWGCRQYPDIETITQFDYRTFGDILISDGQQTSRATGYHSSVITGFQSYHLIAEGEAALQATISFDFGGSDLDYDAEYTDISYVRDDLYSGEMLFPISGSLTLIMMIITYFGDGSPTEFWYFSISFGENGYSVHAESGDYFWNWSVLYGGLAS